MTRVAQLTIRRDTSYSDRMRAYDVRIDRVSVGRLRAGQTMAVSVPEGRHRIQVHIDWCSSAPIEFTAPAGSSLAFACGSNLHGWRALAAIFVVTCRPSTYLWLSEGHPCPRCRHPQVSTSGDRCAECGAALSDRTT